MIPPYRYAVDSSVLEVFAATTKTQREKLLRIFALLADNPFQSGDAVQCDNVGRTIQVKRFGEWTVS